MNVIGSLVEIASKPFILYHKEFIKDFAPEIIALARLSINKAGEKNIRDIHKDKVEHFIRSIENLLKRNMTKTERDK